MELSLNQIVCRGIFSKVIWVTVCMVYCGSVQAKENEFKYSAYLMLDYDQFDSFYREESDKADQDAELRRARVSFKYQFNKNWQAKLQLNMDEQLEIKDVFLKYTGLKFANLIIGQHKEPFGLEALMGSRNLFFIERSMASEAFVPGRSPGLSLQGTNDSITWQTGVFQSDDDQSESLTSRVVWSTQSHKNRLFHVGAGFSQRMLLANEFRLNETLEIHLSESIFETQKIQAQKLSIKGIEGYWQDGGYSSLFEWRQAELKDINANVVEYSGGYWLFAYQFSERGRGYKNGVLTELEVQNDWEIAFRLSELQAHSSETLAFDKQKALVATLGINYYGDRNTKWMMNFSKAKRFISDRELGTGDALSLRFQISF